MKRILLLVSIVALPITILATHNLGGYITAKRVAGNELTITCTIIQESMSTAFRDSVRLHIDKDGSSIDTIWIYRSKSQKYQGTVLKTVFQTNYIFPGEGQYELSVSDPNLIDGIINVSNSVNVPIYIHTDIYLSSNFTQTVEFDSMVTRPYGNVGDSLYYHLHPGIDDQKVTFELVTPLQNNSTPVPGYLFFDASVSEKTGLFSIPNVFEGVYLYCVAASTHQNGQVTSTVYRDFLVWMVEDIGTESTLEPVSGFPPKLSVNAYQMYIEPGTSDTLGVRWLDINNNKQELLMYAPDLEVDEQILSQTNTEHHSQFIISVDAGVERSLPYFLTIRGKSSFKQSGPDTTDNFQTEDIAILVYTDQAMGIPQDKEVRVLKVQPNPVGDVLRISGSQVNEMKYYQIYDMSGRVVQSGNIRTSGTIKVNALGSGMYILKGVDSKMQWSQGRFVKE